MVKNAMAKNKVMSGRLFQSVYRVDSNMNKILQIVLSILGCEWILKEYRVENDDDLEWIRKKYRVDNDTKLLEWYTKKYRVDNDIKLDSKQDLHGPLKHVYNSSTALVLGVHVSSPKYFKVMYAVKYFQYSN